MTTADVTVWLSTPVGERLACLAPEWVATKGYRFSRLAYRRVENEVTELVLVMPLAMAPPVSYFALDSRIEVWVDGRLDTETLWFVRVPPALRFGEDGVLYLEVRAVCALYLLAGRIVAYAAGSAQAVKSGLAGNLMHAIVRENLGSLATADRNLSAYLRVAADPGTGAQVYKTFPRRNVLLVLQELARASAQAGAPIFFDIVWTGETLEFRTYADYRGVDHATGSAVPITLSPEFATLEEPGRMFDHRDEITVVYCAGQGLEAQRLIVSVSDDARRLASPFNRREMFVDARYLSLTDSLATEADGALWRRRPVQRLSGTVQSTPEFAYGVHWGFGDLTAAEFNGEVLAVRVHAVVVEVAKGTRTVTAELRVDSLDIDDPVRRIEGSLDSQSPVELPVFSTTPLDGAVPRAPDGSTTIVDGWLSAAIARIADLTAHAALNTGVHGVGSSYVAKSSRSDQWPDWADIQSKPASFAPGGAAGGDLYGTYPDPLVKSIHGNEFEQVAPSQGEIYVFDSGWPGFVISDVTGIKGVQELAGVYKVPMAGSTGKISDTWLNDTIARLTDITWTNLGSKPTTLAGFGITDAVQNAGTAPSVQTGTDASKPAAGTAGRIYVASDTARIYRDSGAAWVLMGVVAWADVTGKPSTFAPSAHASSHQHGGSDEIATATAAANAIPKAGAGGTLVDTWLSTNIPRLASANLFSTSQTLRVTDAATTTTATVASFEHFSSGTPAAGFGVDVAYNAEDDTANRTMALDRCTWVVATDASRRARRIFYVFDNVGARECMRLESSGTAPMVGFNGVAAVARQSLTALSMSIGTGDNSVVDVGAAFNQTTLNNNFRDLVDKFNAIRTILVNVGIAV